MIGTLKPAIKEATIIGGGFAGMLAAYRLAARGFEVSLYEKGPWLGGMIGTTSYPYGLVERAAHSLRASAPVRALCDELGVELLPRVGSGKSYILRNGAFRKLPLSLHELAALITRAAVMPATGAPQTLEQFGRLHLGKTAVDYLLTPLAFGIYGARPSELEVPLAFPRLGLKQGRPLLASMLARRLRGERGAPMVAPRNGIGELVEKLSQHLHAQKNVHIHTQTEAEFLIPAANRILCTPAYATATLIAEEDHLTAALLGMVRYVPLVTATVFVERKAMKRFPGGIGVLVPEREHIPVLGVLFNSASFEGRVNDHGLESLTVILGGTPNAHLMQQDDAALESHITESLEKLFGLARAPLKTHITRWPNAIPLYDAHLSKALSQAKTGWGATQGNILFGNYTGQVSLRGMIKSSQSLMR